MLVHSKQNCPNEFDIDITFQHDVAPPHCDRDVHKYLDYNFRGRSTGR